MNKLHSMKYAAVLIPALTLGMPMANVMAGSDLGNQRADQREATPPAKPATASARARANVADQHGYLENLPARGYHSDNLVGKEVMNRRNNETIGEVSNLVLDEDGQVLAVIISVGGLMGIGERDVAIEWDQIERKVDGDDIILTVDLTEESLKAAPKYSSERADRPTAMMGSDRSDQRAQAASQRSDPRSNQPDERRGNQGVVGTTPPERPAVASTRSDASDSMRRQDYLETPPARGYHSDSLVGKEVVNRRNNETVGEVSNLVMDENGQVVAVIISVGGLLGIGERDVAIAWDQIERKIDGDDMTLSVDFTEESLKDAPRYSSDRPTTRRQ